ncbi:glycosyltransferase family protein [Desulfovibrio legallii]|uniref:Spore protein YkvP/CgeB glycosyl transferase-like domain-containing protein n=1 Tax=Desulfovibrio legallii TaxID=571438 RepID=A0A1G7LUP1_9BACT|nr:glycosyltransferase [Desulfovibrio legallii]SDF53096.1 protein of unknown function [Desulfovibrio legallii]
MPSASPALGRVRLPDHTGAPIHLSSSPQAWECRGQGQAVLLLGLGPDRPQDLPFAREASTVFWLEAAAVKRALEACAPEAAAARRSLPPHWREVSPRAAVALAPRCRCCFYLPGLRLAPDFWGPLLGRVDAALVAATAEPLLLPAWAARQAGLAPGPARAFSDAPDQDGEGLGAVLLPGADNQLLHAELRQACAACGYGPVLTRLPRPDPERNARGTRAADAFAAAWRDLLPAQKPAMLLSVNLRGLDPEGRVFHLCRALGIPVGVWFVDNPWHVLSALRLPWWRGAHLFVTDPGFMPDLRAQGAQSVSYLPLAAAPHMWRGADDDLPELTAPPLFVGRSAFPEKDRFFAAARLPQAAGEEAAALLQQSRGPTDAPHFFWWQRSLGLRAPWPGNDVRRAGLGAERCSLANRAHWLKAAGAEGGGLRVVGDGGWRALLPEAEILPPVDYYTQLSGLYAAAAAVLNVTSLLLPHSLSQRHFDVWAAGGLLLSDATQGLDLFPRELTEPIALRGPEDFPRRLAELRARPQEARDLRLAWRRHLRARHSYTQRVRRIAEVLGAPLPPPQP